MGISFLLGGVVLECTRKSRTTFLYRKQCSSLSVVEHTGTQQHCKSHLSSAGSFTLTQKGCVDALGTPSPAPLSSHKQPRQAVRRPRRALRNKSLPMKSPRSALAGKSVTELTFCSLLRGTETFQRGRSSAGNSHGPSW